ncbi:MAG: restriction endonuclease [Betaproteobacteria bacterium HGW-Betaproteobacteria-18]|nr:MAG: restriction endonuclease [Betaproteobacteria bacterium HGW-Betaproteobacteria-18]
MTYLERINLLKAHLETIGSPARLDIAFQAGCPPTQAFSEFLTNKEQGDWAKKTFIENFNRTQKDLWAVKYGRSEDLVAGEDGFESYYRGYQEELQEIGKRPDLLIFQRHVIHAKYGLETDLSNLPRTDLDLLVPHAIDAIEVRSSAFLSAKYDTVTALSRQQTKVMMVDCANALLNEFRVEISNSSAWIKYLEDLISRGVDTSKESPRALGRHSTARLEQASGLTKRINEGLKRLRQRDFLSLTPKAEDLSQVYRWIQRYRVPHHYCQVFFDRAIILSFESILEVLGDPDRENIDFFIESDEKNQGKVTFKINVLLGREVMSEVVLPRHESVMKELPKGRLLFYVRFETSQANVSARVLGHV